MPNREFWWGLGVGYAFATAAPHLSYHGGYFGALYGVGPDVIGGLVTVASAGVVLLCAQYATRNR